MSEVEIGSYMLYHIDAGELVSDVVDKFMDEKELDV